MASLLFLVSNYASLAAADTAAAAAGGNLCIDTNVTLAANTTLSAPYVTVAGGLITRGSFALTLSGVFAGTDYEQLTEGGGSGAVTLSKNKRISVRWLGARLDGSTNDSNAFQKAIDTAGAGSEVYLTAGVMKLVTGVTVANNGVSIVGAGSYATQILVAPAATISVVTFSQGGSVSYRNSIRGVLFYSNDGTYQKTAMDVIDCSEFEIDDVVVAGSISRGGSSIWSNQQSGTPTTPGTCVGLRTRGRDLIKTQRLSMYCDMPLQISKNPNTASNVLEDFDHCAITGLYLIAYLNPLITIDAGAGLSNVEFVASQAWVGGTYGVYCNSSFTSQMINVAFRDVRTEQGTDSTAWSFYLNLAAGGISNLSFENCTLDSARKGAYLRGAHRTLFQSCLFEMTSTDAIDITAGSGDRLTALNCKSEASAAVTTTNMVRLRSTDFESNTPLADNAEYVYWNGSLNGYPSLREAEDGKHFAWTGSQADSTAIYLPISTGNGLVMGRGFIHAWDAAHSIEAYADFYITSGGLTLLNQTANVVTNPTAGKLAFNFQSGFPYIANYLGQTVKLNVRCDWRN